MTSGSAVAYLDVCVDEASMVAKYDPMNRCVLLLLAVSTTERLMFNVPVESDVLVESATPSKCSGESTPRSKSDA